MITLSLQQTEETFFCFFKHKKGHSIYGVQRVAFRFGMVNIIFSFLLRQTPCFTLFAVYDMTSLLKGWLFIKLAVHDDVWKTAARRPQGKSKVIRCEVHT